MLEQRNSPPRRSGGTSRRSSGPGINGIGPAHGGVVEGLDDREAGPSGKGLARLSLPFLAVLVGPDIGPDEVRKCATAGVAAGVNFRPRTSVGLKSALHGTGVRRAGALQMAMDRLS
jgi:hypothetical protein